jgi:8-oxo-dGTP diphosphatase
MEHFRPYAAVYILFVKDHKVLMLRRFNTGYQDGLYSFPAGHVDGNETLRAAAAREAKEEVGATIKVEDLEFKLVMHRQAGDREYIDFAFLAKKWEGELENKEPEKCDDVSWFSLDEIPEKTIPYVKEVIRCYREGIAYAEFGF